jgi:uncharacterized protein involved in outer membrane biogenesis
VRILRILLIAGAIVVAVAIAAPLILLAVGISVDVSRLGPQVSEIATDALGRKVTLDGPIYIVPSYWPTLEIHGLRIADPFGAEDAEFMRLGRARVVLDLLPLLRSARVALDEIKADYVRLNLVRYADGNASWAFEGVGGPAEEETAAPADAEEKEAGRSLAFAELEELELRDIAVAWHDQETGERENLIVEECTGAAVAGEPIRLSLAGSVREKPFELRLGAGHLSDLLTARPEMPLDLELSVAGARLAIGLDFDALDAPLAEDTEVGARAAGSYWLTFELKRLDELGRLLGIELPPLGPIAVRAEAQIEPKHWQLSELALRVGETRLDGSASIRDGAQRPLAELELTSTRFRIDDFQAEGWSLAGGPDKGEAQASQAPAEPSPDAPPAEEPTPGAAEPRRAVLDPEVMRLLDAKVALRVDEVLLGEERLGGGELAAGLEDGRLVVDPLVLEIPGGAFALQTELAVDAGDTRAHLAMQVEAFDLGVLARRADPETEMGGIFDLDVELSAHAPDPASLMTGANGHVDVSFEPVNLEAGLLDLWAVNLVAAVLPVVAGGESHINCVVALLDLVDGRMEAQSILIDTTRIQVAGEFDADFHTQKLHAMLQPRPKKPQFFSLGTPVQVNGSFDDFGVGVSALDLAGTVVSLVTDVATFPVRFLFLKRVSPDGKEACAAARQRPPPQAP